MQTEQICLQGNANSSENPHQPRFYISSSLTYGPWYNLREYGVVTIYLQKHAFMKVIFFFKYQSIVDLAHIDGLPWWCRGNESAC